MTKALVAYFSASHGRVTEGVAKKLAAATGADLFAIEPETPYTPADLNWNDPDSRTTKECNDPNSRPALKNPVPDLSAYDPIYVGFPIWWYREPRIVDTFLEARDLAGKTVIPFATSGSSQMGNTGALMQQVVPAATVTEGKRFPGNVTEDELRNWAAQQ
ncbi:MAG: flavodoxin [Eggerthellaceae bacterium]|jgi:flavodoxin